ncbi:MAG: PIN domain-containing protein [Dehalococcoidia bacterium]|nr:PIN domain-containing protein [Dehalococcoidia bacterium]
MKVGIDTDVLAAAEGIRGASRQAAAVAIIRDLPHDSIIVPAPALGELFTLLTRPGVRSASEARAACLGWRDAFAIQAVSSDIVLTATHLVGESGLEIRDAIVMSSVAAADCRLVLSEGLPDGFTWGVVTAVNPFARTRHPLLEFILRSAKVSSQPTI